ncbi:Charged multivesicular body protein 2a, partial [Trichinella pseudospiralis]
LKMALDFLFGRRKTPQEMLRQNQRALNRAMRDLDREKMHLENQEKKIIIDIKKMAKAGQMDAVKVMAKDLVRTRRYVKKFIMMRANIQAVSLKIQTLKSQDAMAQAMKGVTKAMMNLMEMKEEMMNDAIDDAMADEGDEEETDAIVSQVLDELGIQFNEELNKLPPAASTVSPVTGKEQTALADADANLQARLENLRRE